MHKHEYHLVDNSIWPFATGLNLFSIGTALVLVIQQYSKGIWLLYLSIVILTIILYNWWKDVVREASYMGFHNERVIRGIYIGIILFIISEIFLFIGLFWAYIHSALNNTTALGSLWPPIGIEKINPIELPLLNTLLLLSAGFSVTWAHHGYITKNVTELTSGFNPSNVGFVIGILLAIIFTGFQYIEYLTCGFDISDSAFASCFYLATSFHGFHVIVGALFLLSAFLRINLYHFTRIQHTNLICSLWYFHFTDVVWLLLFIVMYVWGFGI